MIAATPVAVLLKEALKSDTPNGPGDPGGSSGRWPQGNRCYYGGYLPSSRSEGCLQKYSLAHGSQYLKTGGA